MQVAFEKGAVRLETAASQFPSISGGAGKSHLLVLTADPRHPLYSSWLPHWKGPWTTVSPAEAAVEHWREAALVVTHDTYVDPGRSRVQEIVAADVPTLILADGILEYRNTWEHPQLVPGAIFQPVLGHKLACIGRSQARVVESWGNAGKCEVVGSPRLDRYAQLRRRERKPGEPFRLLIMTALTPFFTRRHRDLLTSALRAAKAFLGSRKEIAGCRVEPVWRLTKGLERELNVPSDASELTGLGIAEVLQTVDAVLTTASTSMLEAMLLGLPVAVLDYDNSPAYVQPAWRVSAPEHLPTVIEELVNPPAPKLLFQDLTLHDALECATPATPRLLQLISEMVRHSEDARDRGEAPRFPAQILAAETARHSAPELTSDFPVLSRLQA